MKILIFMEDYFCGGVDTFVINLINSWPNAADDLTLICNRSHSGLGLLRDSIKRPFTLVKHNMVVFTGFFERAQKKQMPGRMIELILKLSAPVLRYVFFAYNIFALRRILLKNDPDRLLVVNNGYPAGDSCRAAAISWGLFSKKPHSIHNFHGIALKPGWHIKFQEYIIDALVCRFSKKFISVSRAAAESIACRKIIHRQNKTSYIYNGVTFLSGTQKADYGNSKTEMGIPRDGFLCLMLGAYHHNKNFDKGHYFLMKVFKKVIVSIPGAHLAICGYGSAKDIAEVAGIARGLSMESNVHLYGFRRDTSDLLRDTDILLISSQAFESFCLASIEAMAHQVPVVATRVGAIPEIVLNGKGGYCVDKDDVDSYAGHIMKLLTDDGLRKEQGRIGFQRYKNFFTAQRMAVEYSNLIHGS